MKKVFKCPFCNKKYMNKPALYSHIEKEHPSEIPTGMPVSQAYFNAKYNKTHGRCVMCSKPTKWNESVERYERLCSAECKQKYRDDFRQKMIKRYGKECLLDDPEQQKKMLANRSISGMYEWSDGKSKFSYTGSYEKDFLQFLDKFMRFSPNDIIAPAPQVFKYMDGDKERFYIPDFYIASINTLVEIKDGGSNPNMHTHRTGNDARKEALKDEVMRKQTQYNYVKITDKDYSIFINFLIALKDERIKETECRRPVISISESFNQIENLLMVETFKSELEGQPISEEVIKADNTTVRNPKIVKNQAINQLIENARNVYIATDWHLWQNQDGKIIKNPNFNMIMENCRNTLQKDDVLIYLGDLVDDEFTDKRAVKSVLESLKCHVIMTPGNNDLFDHDFYLECGVDYVEDAFRYKNYVFSHYPIRLETTNNLINFHGHLHGSGFYKGQYHNQADMYNRFGRFTTLTEAVAKFNRGGYKPRKGVIPPKDEIINENALFTQLNEEQAQLNELMDKYSECPYTKDKMIFTESGSMNLYLSEDSTLANMVERSKANIRAYSNTDNAFMLKNEACTLWYTYLVLENYAVNPLRKKLVHIDPVQKSNALKIKANMINEMVNAINIVRELEEGFDFFKYFNETNTNKDLFSETRNIIDTKRLVNELTML